MVDGASRLYVLRTIIAPLLAPGIVVTALFAFITAWNEFFLALVLLQTPDLTTLPLLLAQFVGIEGIVRLGPLAASALLATLPSLILFTVHPALADARPHVRGGQGLVHYQPKGGPSMKKILGFSTALVLCVTLAASAAQAGKSKQNVVEHQLRDLRVAADHGQGDERDRRLVEQDPRRRFRCTIVPVDVNSVHDKLLTSFVGGTAADIIHDEAADIAGFTQQGYLANLTPLIPKALKAEIPQSVWDTVNFGNGKVTGVPIMLQTYNVFANMTALKAAGIKAPTATNPWTWAQFRAVVEEAVDERQLRRLLGPPLADRARSRRSRSTGAASGTTSRSGKWVLKVGTGEQTTLTTDARHDLQRQVDRPGRRRPLRLGRAAGVLRRQVRDDRAGQLPGAGHDPAEPEGLQLGDVPAAQGHDAGPGGEPADAVDLVAEPAQGRGDAVHRLRAQRAEHGEARRRRLADPGRSRRRRRSSSSRRSTTAAGRTPSRRCRTSRRRTGSR